MERCDHGEAERPDHLEQLELGGDVEVVGRPVEHEHLWFLSQHPGQEHLFGTRRGRR
jgi:hypothetical protein